MSSLLDVTPAYLDPQLIVPGILVAALAIGGLVYSRRKSLALPTSAPAPKERGNESNEPSKLQKKDLSHLTKGLSSTRKGLVERLSGIFSGKSSLDPQVVSEVEEVLLSSDVGPQTTFAILEQIRSRIGKKETATPEVIWEALRAEAKSILTRQKNEPLKLGHTPSVILMVGVNGAGKTTTIGKLATQFKGAGKSVMLAAGDTFRAAAVQQLIVWGERVGAEVVQGKEGADPASVAYEAVKKAEAAKVDILIIDTAGRLHTKAPLMDEIIKVRRTVAKALGREPDETLLVLDATTGQNGVAQAKTFQSALELTGIVLTKMDGTAKGGVILAIAHDVQVPVRYIGLGEQAEDLRPFHAEDFVEALFAKD